MNWAHIHLLVNHFPIVGGIMVVLMMAYGLWRGKTEIIRLSLILWVFLALMTIAVYWSGSEASDMVRHLPGVQKSFIHNHDNSATYSLTAMEVLGGLSLLGLWFYRKEENYPAAFTKAVFIFSFVALALVGWTSNLGGQIRHPEVRPGFQPPPITQPPTQK